MALRDDDAWSNASDHEESVTSVDSSDDEGSTISETEFDPEDTVKLEMPDSMDDKIRLEPLKSLTEQVYVAGRAPRYGKSNPEIMDVPFWSTMITAQKDPYGAYCILKDSDSFPSHNDVTNFLKSDAPDLAEDEENGREQQQVAHHQAFDRLPTWTFANRMGQTMTKLPDGRFVFIAGEHEDFYDPDFHIYNDVCVYDQSSTASDLGSAFVIYGYPREVFPPTDFHTATLVTGTPDIYIIGAMGYGDQRRPGETPVYRLDTRDFSMHAIETSGEKPGWINHHSANVVEDGTAIRVVGKQRRYFGSKVCVEDEKGQEDIVDFVGEYLLHLETGRWTKVS
ncbi:hypothetical protein PG990_007464 [Apiospora arundinis]